MRSDEESKRIENKAAVETLLGRGFDRIE